MAEMDSRTLAESLTEEQLTLRLKDTEHDFVERKPKSQKGEWLQAAVAFANSAPIGWPAVLFVGADAYGNPQEDIGKLEDLEKTVSDMLNRACPAIYRHVVPLHFGGKGCLAVVIPGSDNRPHFAGKSYIRDGAQTREASSEQFDDLIADRMSKVRELKKYLGRSVSYKCERTDPRFPAVQTILNGIGTLKKCTPHYVVVVDDRPNMPVQSFPLSRVDLCLTTLGSEETLMLEIRPPG